MKHPSDNAHHIAGNLVGAESKITIKQCANQCRGSDRTGMIGKKLHDIGKADELHIDEQDEQDRSFDVVRVNYINLYSVMSVIFNKLESSTRQR